MPEQTPCMIQIARELSLPLSSVAAAMQLLESGNTVPFIARYRKEATGNLDEVQIRQIQERSAYLNELEARRQTILASIESQGKLTDDLKRQILACQAKTALEDLYLPYKPKRRTRAMIAREKGLEPLADLILSQSFTEEPEAAALAFIDAAKGVENSQEALNGARDIVAEKIAENAAIRACVREAFSEEGVIVSKVRTDKVGNPTKFEQYYDFKEKVKTIPSHRYLAIRRGEKGEILDFSIEIEEQSILEEISHLAGLQKESPFANELSKAAEDAYKRLLAPSVETDVRLDLKWASDREAVNIFAENLRHLLLAPPLGAKNVIGIDPGIRTGCKCAAIDKTGQFLDTVTIYPYQGDQSSQQASDQLFKFIKRFNPFAIAIGNGTAGRETEMFVRKLLNQENLKEVLVISVNESGASVYSASDVAREEFPDLDLTIRGAISIARRLQDPLAELVKIDPKSIGVGQYQHDVHQPLLHDQLHQVVESCVNHVGVDLNTASAPLLSYVSGIGPGLANEIIKYRNSQGAFHNRKELKKIHGFGPKTFEQAAGFLRIYHGDNLLDASAVHPERYELVEQIAKDLDVALESLLCNHELITHIDLKRYVNSSTGILTLNDIVQELQKPGRDPRDTFEPPSFRNDILSIQDLKPAMQLEGIVTNVTAFGAFIDIGVHQDGLIHLSELSDRFIKHPGEVVSPGNKIKVEVLQVDVDRKRISLTARVGQKRDSATLPNRPATSQSKGKQVNKKSFNTNPFSNL